VCQVVLLWKGPTTLSATLAARDSTTTRFSCGRGVEAQIQRDSLARCVSIMARCWSSPDNTRGEILTPSTRGEILIPNAVKSGHKRSLSCGYAISERLPG
jgi:hypothetical protein